MGRLLAALVFAVAAAGTTLAASGIVVPPHVDPPGTPRVHDHFVATYRYAIYLPRLERPLLGGVRLGPAPRPGPAFDALVLASLAVLVPRLPRPDRRAIARLAAPRVGASQWGAVPALGPPRASTLFARLTETIP